MEWIRSDWIGVDWITLGIRLERKERIRQDLTGLGCVGFDWIRLNLTGLDWIGFDWIGLDQIGDQIGKESNGLDWIGFDWNGFDQIGLDKIGDALMYRDQKLETMEMRSVR